MLRMSKIFSPCRALHNIVVLVCDIIYFSFFLSPQWIVLDDSHGGAHGGSNGDSLFFRGGIAGTLITTLAANSGTGLLQDGTTYSFWLRYTQSSGTIDIGLPTDRNTVVYTGTDSAATKLAVEHIFVQSSAATNMAATFKICTPASE